MIDVWMHCSYYIHMKTVEWNGTNWCLVHWEDVGFLTRRGKIIAALRSKSKLNAECEAMLKGLL